MSKTIAAAFSNPAGAEKAKKTIHYDLTMKAYEIVTHNLERFGNTLGEDHRAALVELVGGFTLLAFGLKKGRFAYPLPTGMGKTQSIVAWCAALQALDYQDVSVAVAAGKVEALCQLKRDLIANGVPSEAIGLLHSYKHDAGLTGELPQDYASEPATKDNDDRQIMLVTHTRIHKGNLSQFNEYRGKARNLLVWDESLLVSESRFISHRQVKKALGFRLPDLQADCEAVRYFGSVIATIDEELARQKAGEDVQLISIPELSTTEADTIRHQIGNGTIEEALQQLLLIAQRPLRVAYTHQDGGLISYDITVPVELSSIAILDASYPIRDLERMDKSIQLGGKFSSNMKRYDHVTIHHLKAASGRDSLTRDFSNNRKEDRKISLEVCNLVAGLPDDEGVIVFTFKKLEGLLGSKRTVDFKNRLREDLKASGVDVCGKVIDQGNPVDRIVMLTWGQETSLSQYSYCKHVVFAGVLHRSHLSLASSIAAQADNLLHKITAETINEVMTSEIAHGVYQALSRGACRKIEGSQAHKMDAWLIHNNEDIRPRIELVMPGVQWVTWKGDFITSTNTASNITKIIVDYLKGAAEGIEKISTSMLKKATGLTKVPATTFTRSLNQALNEEDTGWKLDKLSVVRYSIDDFGFLPRG
jgi:hypothetical protein